MNQQLWNSALKKNQTKLQLFGIKKESEIVPYEVRKALTSWDFQKRYLEKRRLKQMVKGKVTESIFLEAGTYEGIIKENRIREGKSKQGDTYQYHETYIIVEKDGKEVEAKCGVPFNITNKSKLGAILMRFGCDIMGQFDKEIDTDSFLKPKTKVAFSVEVKGDYFNVNPDSLRPSA